MNDCYLDSQPSRILVSRVEFADRVLSHPRVNDILDTNTAFGTCWIRTHRRGFHV